MVAFVHQGYKIQPARARCHLDAHAGVSPPGRNGLRNGCVRWLGQFVARHGGGFNARLRQQVIDQHSGARAPRPVHKTGAGACHIRQAVQRQWVARRHHEPLRAPGKANDLVQSRFEQRLVGARGQRVSGGLLYGVKARQRAPPLVQRTNGVHAAGEANVKVQWADIRVCCGIGAQGGQRIVMARVHREHVRIGIERNGKCALQIGVQRGNLRGQPGLCLAFGPQQLGAELAQLRGLALAPGDKFAAQLVFPALERPPDMAIGKIQSACRAGNGAVFGHRLQQLRQRVADERIACVLAQGVVKLDPMHGCSYGWVLMGCLR